MPRPPEPVEFPHLGQVIAVSSGKGGVGKSTVTANVAVALAQNGKKVGILDADIYGPNIPRMFGRFERPEVKNQRIQPLEAFGVKLMSIGFLVDRDVAAIWRGPIIMKVLQQFLRDVEWGELDYLVIDLPPGTGDAALSISQLIPLSGAVVVTTPQEVSLMDARKAIAMFTKVNVRTLGVIENMSAFICPDCGHEHDIFGSGGGDRMARDQGLEVLGHIPLEPAVRTGGDGGVPITSAQHPASDTSAAAAALRDVARTVAGKVSVLAAPVAAAAS